MRTISGGNFSAGYAQRGKYGVPIRGGLLLIAEDTTFVGSNFCAASPHSAVFDLSPGVRLVLEGCNLVNCTVPDGAEVHGGNLAHLIPTPTGNRDRPTVNLLHDCDKCASARRVLVDRIAAGTAPKDATGRIRHDLLKDAFRARRESASAEDIVWQRASNTDALARHPADGGR